MTPEEKQKLEDLERRLKEAEEYIAQKKIQQISLPLDDASRNVIGGETGLGTVNFGEGSILTISGGMINPSESYHQVDTEGGAASDDLDSIEDVGHTRGDIFVIRPESSSRTVVAKDGTGNLRLAGDFSMDNTNDTLTLILVGSAWYEVSRSDNAA